MPYIASGRRGDVLGGLDPDAKIDVDPSSAFAGWTNRQLNEYWAAQGVAVLSPQVQSTGVVNPSTGVAAYDPAAVAASNAALTAGAAADPTVAAALNTLKTGAFGSDVAERSAANEAANAVTLAQDAARFADSFTAAGGVFADQMAPGTTYDADFLKGNLTRDQWIDSFIKTAPGTDAASVGLSPEEAVTAGILTPSEADYIKRKTAGQDVSNSPSAPKPAMPTGPAVYFQNGRSVDAFGQPISTGGGGGGPDLGVVVPRTPARDQAPAPAAGSSLPFSPWLIAGAGVAALLVVGSMKRSRKRS